MCKKAKRDASKGLSFLDFTQIPFYFSTARHGLRHANKQAQISNINQKKNLTKETLQIFL
jgi:hypothetical protein